jgi:hypothetical protein
MANYSIEIPGNANVTMNVGDGLQIDFKSAAKLCVDSGNPNAFNPALPSGAAQAKGTVWPSATTYAIANVSTTVTYTHCANDKNCGSSGKPTGGVSGTIKVGSGTK